MDGTVTSFDDDRGYGAITGSDGREHFFHCTQLADGSRTIEVGTAVCFELRPGHAGRWEASSISPRG